MKTVEEVRVQRLLALKVEFGTLVEINKALGLTTRDSTLSQLLNASTGTKTQKPKAMGSPMARRLETACKKPVGWMDTDPDALDWPFEEVDQSRFIKLTDRQKGRVEQAMLEMIERIEQEQQQSTGTGG